MGHGEPIKATIWMYHQKRVNRPPNDYRKVSSASLVYFRGKEHMDAMIKLWEETGRPLKEEYTLTLYIDQRDGGWKGLENYRKYDTPFYTMTKLYPNEKKEVIFGHYSSRVVSSLLGDGKNINGIKDRIDKMAVNL